LGWDGRDDAWYALPIVDAYYYFDTIDNCVYNVFTSGTGEIISGRVTNMTGNPIPGVNMSAQASGTGTYLATTNDKGIYAFVGLPSNKTYTVTASKPPYSFINQYPSTGQSTDNSSTSGNKWAMDFAAQNPGPPIAYNQEVSVISGSSKMITLQAADDGLPNPPARLTYKITQLPLHGRLMDPAGGRIVNVPYALLNNGNIVEYKSCLYYTGQDNFEFVANDSGTPPQGGDSSPAAVTINIDNLTYTTFAPIDNVIAYWPLRTSYHDARTQVIYLSSNIGSAKKITDLAVDIYQAPGQVLNNWTIRMKHTTKSSYTSSFFETAGWITVYQGSEQPTPIGWRYFHLQAPFEYNGTSNLLIDFTFNNTSGSTDGYCMVSDVGATRVAMSWANSTHGNPLSWTDANTPGIYTAKGVPNIKLIGTVSATPLAGDFEPDCEVDIADLLIFTAAWLSENGQSLFNQKCDIFLPADNLINFKDLATLANNWLTNSFQ